MAKNSKQMLHLGRVVSEEYTKYEFTVRVPKKGGFEEKSFKISLENKLLSGDPLYTVLLGEQLALIQASTPPKYLGEIRPYYEGISGMMGLPPDRYVLEKNHGLEKSAIEAYDKLKYRKQS